MNSQEILGKLTVKLLARVDKLERRLDEVEREQNRHADWLLALSDFKKADEKVEELKDEVHRADVVAKARAAGGVEATKILMGGDA
jgi:hypothetical protein